MLSRMSCLYVFYSSLKVLESYRVIFDKTRPANYKFCHSLDLSVGLDALFLCDEI